MLLGNGDGTFQPAIPSLLGVDANVVTAGDYNGDGRLDVALLSDFGIITALGDGQGRFQQPINYPAGGYATGVATGDFNADGKIDVAIANGNGFGVLSGLGGGQFQPKYSLQQDFLPAFAVSGDFNHDGVTDLVVAGSHGTLGGPPDGYQVYFGGSGGLTAGPLGTNVLVDMNSLITGRFRPGGNLDLAFAFNAGANYTSGVGVLLGNGDGSFKNPKLMLIPGNAAGVAAADFNRDGKLDLVVGASAGELLLLGNGDGTFQAPQTITVPSGTYSAAATADLNGDGKADLVLADSFDEQIVVLLGNGDGTSNPPRPSTPTKCRRVW